MTAPDSEAEPAPRRILDDLGSDSGPLAFAHLSTADLLVVVPGLVVAMLALEVVVLLTDRFLVGVGVAGVVLVVTAAVIVACPDHRTPWGLARAYWQHRRRETTMRFTAATDTTEETATPPDVRALTHVRAVASAADAIRRQDETLVGAVRVRPANLALAADSDWERAATDFGDVLNTLEYPVQIHAAARRVDPDRLTVVYDRRRRAPDVQATPVLRDLVDVYRERRPQQFRERDTSVREYYVLIPVPVRAVSLDEQPWVRRLRRVPLVGDALAAPLADWIVYDDRRERIRSHQRRLLADRRQQLVTQLDGVHGVSATPVGADQLVALLEGYWTGRRGQYPERDTAGATDAAGPACGPAPVVLRGDAPSQHQPSIRDSSTNP